MATASRLRHLSRVLRGERQVTTAVRGALDVLLQSAARALQSAGYDTSVLDSRLPGWRQALDREVGPAILAVFSEAWEVTDRGGINPEAYATRHLESVWNRLVGVSDEVFDTMRLTLEEGRRSQEGIPELAARIDLLLGDEQRWTNRAVTIARTETMAANNAGAAGSALATAGVLGIDPSMVVKEWMATSDSRTRDTHKRADGQQVLGLDNEFSVGSARGPQPGSMGRAEEDVNCRCTVVFHYPGDPDYPATLSAGNLSGDLPRFPGTPPGSTADAMQTAPAVAPAAAVAQVADPVVDSGPQTALDVMARGLTIGELEVEARTGSASARKAARNELRRRGLAASASYAPQEEPVSTPTPETEPSPDAQPDTEQPLPEPTHAGIAVQAADTGRLLLIQRSLDQDDAPDVAGTWEFPGGGIEEGETPEAAAWREFTEETGLPAPPGEVTGGWLSPDGVYQGYAFTTPAEDGAFPAGINPAPEDRVAVDPDSPTAGRVPDVQAWFTLEQIDALGPALRPAVRDNTDWEQFMPTPPSTDQAGTGDLDAALTLVRDAGYTVGLTAADEPVPADAPAAPGTPETADAIPEDGDPFYGILWPENVQSGDGRGIEAGATTNRDLPLPIMAQDAQAMGHDGAVRVGRMDTLVRDDTTYSVPVMRYTGVWDTSAAALETARQVDRGVVRGISTDGDAVTVELRGSNGQVLDPMSDDFPEDGVVLEVATAARVSGGTVCSIPAFHQAYIANGRLEDRTEPEPGWNDDGTPKDNTLDAPAPVEDGEALPLVASADGGARRAPVWTLTAGASVLPVVEARYFTNPGLDEPTPLTVDDDGRVYGHLATWGICHIGIDGYCQEAPVSASNYAHYAKGVVLTDTGERVRVGPLTMGTGHAGMDLGLRAAAEHYDNTGTVVADLAIGQDAVGIWFSGRIRPDATPEQVYALSAAGAVSGDWREAVRYSGDLELVAALVVNVPGFSIPRPAVAASAASGLAMVAAGMVPPRPGQASVVVDHAAIAAAVVAHLDRREKARAASARLDTRRAVRRALRVTEARSRLTRTGGQ